MARCRAWLAGAALNTVDRMASRDASQKRSAGVPQLATVVPFPLNGRGVLLQLARELGHAAVADVDDADDPVLLTLARGDRQRLLIDSTAYMEIGQEPLPYRVVLGDAFTTRITLETANVSEARAFISQYLLLTRGFQAEGGTS
ncbi:hypothetical protein [Hyphomicrobium sp. 2TAF46]|uniref:hypothetical protein n=1 Tax=Hyphomicrobium sp. 2TAF46 TaxID=3233019 RepID=UPI003F8FC247